MVTYPTVDELVFLSIHVDLYRPEYSTVCSPEHLHSIVEWTHLHRKYGSRRTILKFTNHGVVFEDISMPNVLGPSAFYKSKSVKGLWIDPDLHDYIALVVRCAHASFMIFVMKLVKEMPSNIVNQFRLMKQSSMQYNNSKDVYGHSTNDYRQLPRFYRRNHRRRSSSVEDSRFPLGHRRSESAHYKNREGSTNDPNGLMYDQTYYLNEERYYIFDPNIYNSADSTPIFEKKRKKSLPINTKADVRSGSAQNTSNNWRVNSTDTKKKPSSLNKYRDFIECESSGAESDQDVINYRDIDRVTVAKVTEENDDGLLNLRRKNSNYLESRHHQNNNNNIEEKNASLSEDREIYIGTPDDLQEIKSSSDTRELHESTSIEKNDHLVYNKEDTLKFCSDEELRNDSSRRIRECQFSDLFNELKHVREQLERLKTNDTSPLHCIETDMEQMKEELRVIRARLDDCLLCSKPIKSEPVAQPDDIYHEYENIDFVFNNNAPVAPDASNYNENLQYNSINHSLTNGDLRYPLSASLSVPSKINNDPPHVIPVTVNNRVIKLNSDKRMPPPPSVAQEQFVSGQYPSKQAMVLDDSSDSSSNINVQSECFIPIQKEETETNPSENNLYDAPFLPFFSDQLTNPMFAGNRQLLLNTLANQFGLAPDSPDLLHAVRNQEAFVRGRRTFANLVWNMSAEEERVLKSSSPPIFIDFEAIIPQPTKQKSCLKSKDKPDTFLTHNGTKSVAFAL